MQQRNDIERKRTHEEMSSSSDDEELTHHKANIPGLTYIARFTQESGCRLLNNAVVEIILIFNSNEAAYDFSRQLVILNLSRPEYFIFADKTKVTYIAEHQNHGNFRRVYLAPQAAKNFAQNPSYRSNLIMQQLHDLYDLSNAGEITCNLSNQQVTKRVEASNPLRPAPANNFF